MNLQAFSGPNRTLTGVTQERSDIEKPSFLGKLLTRKNKLKNTLQDIIDVEKDLEVYTNHQLNQILYKINALHFNIQLLRINREEEILVTIEPINLALISKESTIKIKQSGKKLLHLGLIIIGIKGLVRKNLGTKELISFLDNE